MIDIEKSEWFEFVSSVDVKLNELSKTHSIVQVHYVVAPSSVGEGFSKVLVEAVKRGGA